MKFIKDAYDFFCLKFPRKIVGVVIGIGITMDAVEIAAIGQFPLSEKGESSSSRCLDQPSAKITARDGRKNMTSHSVHPLFYLKETFRLYQTLLSQLF